MWSLWIVATLAAKPPTADLSALTADLAACETHLKDSGAYQFAWTEDELADLAKGDFVKRRERMDGADRAMGAIWTPASMDQVWIAVQDEIHWDAVKGLTEERLPGSTFQNKILFQSIDLPWPFADRQWVIEVVNNQPLFTASAGKCWERTWSPHPARGAENELEDGVWVETNDGGWFLGEAAGGSLLVYHVRTTIGGNVPEDAATSWSMMTLGGMLKDLAEKSRESAGHYTADHPAIRRPDGSNIAVFSGSKEGGEATAAP